MTNPARRADTGCDVSPPVATWMHAVVPHPPHSALCTLTSTPTLTFTLNPPSPLATAARGYSNSQNSHGISPSDFVRELWLFSGVCLACVIGVALLRPGYLMHCCARHPMRCDTPVEPLPLVVCARRTPPNSHSMFVVDWFFDVLSYFGACALCFPRAVLSSMKATHKRSAGVPLPGARSRCSIPAQPRHLTPCPFARSPRRSVPKERENPVPWA